MLIVSEDTSIIARVVFLMEQLDDEYDYIVVGSGAGGGPVAVNLAKAGFRVLIIEAGGDEEPPEYKVPAFHALATEHRDMAWKFYVRHYADDDRQKRDVNFLKGCEVDQAPRDGIFYPRAGTLGGCTAHHAMIFVSPHNSDWDHIAALTGDRSWKAKRMRRYFQRVECCGHLKQPWTRWLNWGRRGFNGWLPTSIADPAILLRDLVLARLVTAALQACLAMKIWSSPRGWHQFLWGLEAILDPSDLRRVGLFDRTWKWVMQRYDPNDWHRLKGGYEGPAFVPLTVGKGGRFGTRELIRETMRIRPDRLTVKLHALATRVLLDDTKRAVAVEFLERPDRYRADPAASLTGDLTATPRTVRAKYEIILAGGAFNTPQLLMLSGIGQQEHLTKHGIETKVPLPGVGRNLQDRYEIGVCYRMKRDLALLEHVMLTTDDTEYTEFRNGGYGLYATNGALLSIIKRSSRAQRDPDLYLFAIASHFSGYRPGYSERGRDKNSFTWAILKGHTGNNAGRVRLHSGDPRDPPDINFHFFDEGSDVRGDDLDCVVSGIEFVRRIAARTAGIFDEEIPGPNVRTRSELAQFVKDNAWGHHACGTCKIGADGDEFAVLDHRFQVKGTQGLRVVDASVFPRIPGFFILSAIYMIAEKASDVILDNAERHGWTPSAPGEQVCDISGSLRPAGTLPAGAVPPH